jgi:hypothetical protein
MQAELDELTVSHLKKLLYRTWDSVSDDMYKTVSRNEVWEVCLDRAYDYVKSPEEKVALELYRNSRFSTKEKEKLKRRIFAYRWYEGGRP